MKKKIFFLPIAISLIIASFGFTNLLLPVDDEENAISDKLNSFDKSLGSRGIKDIIQTVGESFIGTEYVAGTLDKDTKKEKLVVMISGLDCVTFVENTLTFSRVIQSGNTDIGSFKKELMTIRYRNGKIEGYASRLHYFTDWIYDNGKKGIVENITKKIGGVPYKKKINFMTEHSSSYKQLAEDDGGLLEELKSIENQINQRKMYYIPKAEVDSYYDDMQTGDIIATTTKIDGLDVTHTGFIYKRKGKTYFLHASIVAKEVIISKEELKEYLNSDKKKTGIMIARPLDVN